MPAINHTSNSSQSPAKKDVTSLPSSQQSAPLEYQPGSHISQPGNPSTSPELPTKPNNGSTSNSVVTKVAPQSSLTLFTYRAQLTFGVSNPKTVNVADFFIHWFEASKKHLKDFALLPYDEGSRQPITAILQEDPDEVQFYTKHYSNHRVLNHGNLTGMVHFQTSTLWSAIKSYKAPYFILLTTNIVFLNLSKFKMETLVPCGFLVGTHSGHL